MDPTHWVQHSSQNKREALLPPGQKRSARPMVTLPSAQAGLEKSLQAQTSQTQQKPTGGPFLESRTLLLHLKPKNAFKLD